MIAPFLPMLAVSGEPFDSAEHLFEVKWDGVRAVAAVEQGGYRVWGRELADYGPRYPELEVLRRFPAGTVVDGELVVLQQGRARLEAILRRHQLTNIWKIQHACRQSPVTYVLFDLVQWQGQPLFDQPLRLRRDRLEEVLKSLEEPSLAFSEGIVGAGREFFQQVTARGHEGMMAKHLSGRYLPGRRASGWRKIKPHLVLPCVILGYLPAREGFRGLVVAAPHEGRLQYAAMLTGSFSAEVQARLTPLLVQRVRREAIIACPEKAIWVEPGLYCQVRCLERTPLGRLRGASFQAMIGEPE